MEASMEGRTLDFIALGILCFVVIMIIYAIIYIHDIPYEIAKKRKHPHQDAIHTAGWVSLFLMHTIWPFLWIWATLYKPDYGWGFSGKGGEEDIQNPEDLIKLMDGLQEKIESNSTKHEIKIAELQERIKSLELQPETGKEV